MGEADLKEQERQQTARPHSDAPQSLSLTAHVFAGVTLVLVSQYVWARRWLLSGAPLLCYSVLLGNAKGRRFLPFIPLWTFLSTLNLAYALAATSWLLFWVFVVACYPSILLSCLFQFPPVTKFARTRLKRLLKDSHIFSDKIAFFNLPALEIDTEVDGLFVIRGITLSFSSLSITAHGVEVAVKVAPDVELAITTDKVVVSLFRRIEVDDVYANLKGGQFEMTLGDTPRPSVDGRIDTMPEPGAPSALLRAATLSAENLSTPLPRKNPLESAAGHKDKPKAPPRRSSARVALESVQTVSPDDEEANEQYQDNVRQIEETSTIRKSQDKLAEALEEANAECSFDSNDDRQLRAAICTRLHSRASIPHPPQRSVTVTALRNLSSPATRRFMHRLPMLLRLLLNPLSYFHPIKIASISAAGSGEWIKYLLQTHVFKDYSEHNSDIRKLETRINKWLTDASFVLQLDSVNILAHVPFLTSFDIEARLSIDDINVHRALPQDLSLYQVVRLRGAEAYVAIPSFLLPHHEHLLPPVPSKDDQAEKERYVESQNERDPSNPANVEAVAELERLRKDETTIKMSARARLPAVIHQQLLDFVAALVKATKFIEIEKSLEERHAEDSTPLEDEIVDVLSDVQLEADGESLYSIDSVSTTSPNKTHFKDSMKAFNSNLKDSIKTMNKKVNTGVEKTWRRGIVGGMANDRWIAKLVGKVVKTLETVRGDVGYSGVIPIPLKPYREMAEPASKLLA